MRFEYRIWNINPDWTPMKATTIEQAADEIKAMGPYGEEAQVRHVETGDRYTRAELIPPPAHLIHGINCECCPTW